MVDRQKARTEEAIRQMIAELIVRRVKDPRVSAVSIIDVRLSKDHSLAKILYNIVGGKERQDKVQEGLESCKNFIRGQLKKNLRLRVIPELVFMYDVSLDRAMAIEELIQRIHDEENPPDDEGVEND
jgi:ribosome-binding factor A